MDVIVSLGVVGSVASIIGLLIAAPGLKSKIIHVAYAIAITLLSAWIVHYQSELSLADKRLGEIRSVEMQAKALLETFDRSTAGSAQGSMLAALAFLEKHKEALPDTYSRATKLCENSGCLETAYKGQESSYSHYLSVTDAAKAIEALLLGLSRAKLE